MRHDGRQPDELRPVEIIRGFTKAAPGSVLIRAGSTHVLCTACIADEVPEWREASGAGWVTAEYDMLPASTGQRRARNRTKVDGRTQEIQRLIGRSMRTVVDMKKLGQHTIYLDCDVLQADGGTRTASVTGAYVALFDALVNGAKRGLWGGDALAGGVAAVSVGIVDGVALLDLNYKEDVAAEVDCNLVMTNRGEWVEVQGTGERTTFSDAHLAQMLSLGRRGIERLMELQRVALEQPLEYRAMRTRFLLCASVPLWFLFSPARAAADKDDEFSAIRCASLRGPQRFDQAKKCQESLKKVRGLKDSLIQVFEEDGVSNVYYGKYRLKFDPRTGKESYDPDPTRDLETIRSLSVRMREPDGRESDIWPFQLLTMAALPGPPSRYPQWELTNNRGHYSLQVGVFYNTGDFQQRRKAAEEYCRLLREQKEEAWFHHGATNSSVTIGSFPKEAIQTFRKENALTGVLEFSNRMVDEKLLALQRRFPNNLHNGHIFKQIITDTKTGKKSEEPHLSFPVEVPKPKKIAGGLGG
jgi:ribonuclease PH